MALLLNSVVLFSHGAWLQCTSLKHLPRIGTEIPNCNDPEVDFPSAVSALPILVCFIGAQPHHLFLTICDRCYTTVSEQTGGTTVSEMFTIRPFLRKFCWYLLCLMDRTACLKFRTEIYFKIENIRITVFSWSQC